VQHLARDTLGGDFQARRWKSDRIEHRRAEGRDGDAGRQVRSGGSEDIAPVEGMADLGETVARVTQFHQRLHRLAGHHVTEDAVVGADEVASGRA